MNRIFISDAPDAKYFTVACATGDCGDCLDEGCLCTHHSEDGERPERCLFPGDTAERLK